MIGLIEKSSMRLPVHREKDLENMHVHVRLALCSRSLPHDATCSAQSCQQCSLRVQSKSREGWAIMQTNALPSPPKSEAHRRRTGSPSAARRRGSSGASRP